jgi:hypothetical protein
LSISACDNTKSVTNALTAHTPYLDSVLLDLLLPINLIFNLLKLLKLDFVVALIRFEFPFGFFVQGVLCFVEFLLQFQAVGIGFLVAMILAFPLLVVANVVVPFQSKSFVHVVVVCILVEGHRCCY